MADTPPATITLAAPPTPTQQEQVRLLVERAAAADGHRAVNEAGLLALRHGDPAVDPAAEHADREDRAPIHLLAHDRQTGDVIGYAQAVWEGHGQVAALVVDPAHRRRGLGVALWQTLTAQATTPLRVWASGNSPAAGALAARLGLSAVRTLLVLGRSLSGDLPATTPPPGITIRTFRSGDEDGWLAVNARAFATHPEQGAMTRSDLDERMAQPWFDPDGLFLAVRRSPAGPGTAVTDEVVGFHWTKREPGSTTGEVYVIGVDPAAGIRGLGTPLLGTGLRHLRDSGATAVELYVEADNAPALSLYRRYGFTPVTADVMYAETETG